MKIILRISLVALFLVQGVAAQAGTPIPGDSKQIMDFRGKSHLTRVEFEKLYQCKTYEELRKQLVRAAESLDPPDCAAAAYAIATCQFALIRTNYILGDIKKADELFLKMHPVHRTAPPVKKEKGTRNE